MLKNVLDKGNPHVDNEVLYSCSEKIQVPVMNVDEGSDARLGSASIVEGVESNLLSFVGDDNLEDVYVRDNPLFCVANDPSSLNVTGRNVDAGTRVVSEGKYEVSIIGVLVHDDQEDFSIMEDIPLVVHYETDRSVSYGVGVETRTDATIKKDGQPAKFGALQVFVLIAIGFAIFLCR